MRGYEAEVVDGANSNGGTATEPSTEAPERQCEVCHKPLTKTQDRTCSHACASSLGGRTSASRPKGLADVQPLHPPTPAVVPVAPVHHVVGDPALVLASWGRALDGLDRAGIRLTGFTVELGGGTWNITREELNP
jgi:hypothetical protein